MNISPVAESLSRQQPNSQTAARGFTLTELAIVLGIIGIILGAIWVAASQVYANNRTKTATTEAMTILNNWKTIYSTKRVDAGNWVDITPQTISNNFAPSEMGSTDPLSGPWPGSTVQIYSYQANNGIIFSIASLSQAACNGLANTIVNSNMIWFSVNGSLSAWLPPVGTGISGGTNGLPTVPQINAACVAGYGNYVQVMYPM